jgi:hypothetical protein
MFIRLRKPLLCRLNVRHKWHTESTDDGGRYARCQRCGKDETGPLVTARIRDTSRLTPPVLAVDFIDDDLWCWRSPFPAELSSDTGGSAPAGYVSWVGLGE